MLALIFFLFQVSEVLLFFVTTRSKAQRDLQSVCRAFAQQRLFQESPVLLCFLCRMSLEKHLGRFTKGVGKQGVTAFAWRPGSCGRMTVRCRSDRKRWQCTGKRLSRAIWSSFDKEGMSPLCDSTVASSAASRDNVLASTCEYPAFRYTLLNLPEALTARTARFMYVRTS